MLDSAIFINAGIHAMTQTYSQVTKQIAALQAKAERIKQQEVTGVVEKIRVAIAVYGISADQLFSSSPAVSARASGSPPAKSPRKKYADDEGNTWSGMGPRPGWLQKKIEAGASLDDFDTTTSTSARAGSVGLDADRTKSGTTRSNGAGRQAKSKTESSPAVRMKYSDGAKSWSGRGPKPKWLKDAIDAGKSLEEFRVGS